MTRAWVSYDDLAKEMAGLRREADLRDKARQEARDTLSDQTHSLAVAVRAQNAAIQEIGHRITVLERDQSRAEGRDRASSLWVAAGVSVLIGVAVAAGVKWLG